MSDELAKVSRRTQQDSINSSQNQVQIKVEALVTLDQIQCKTVISPATSVSNVPGSRSLIVISVETDHLGTMGDVAQAILIELEIKSKTEQSLVKLLPINHQMTIRQEKKKERGQR